MSLTAFVHVTGTFIVVGKSPDGDSIRFIPDDETGLDDIYRAHLLRPSNVDGSHQLRLDGIDAPETHYGKFAQPLGDVTRDYFLKKVVGFTSVTFGRNETVTAAMPETIKGAILTAAADPHGRPIAYILDHGRPNPFGVQTHGMVSADTVRHTANFHMVANGEAYALLYTSQPRSHRAVLSAAGKAARAAKKGVWKLDATPRFPLNVRNDLLAGEPDAKLIFPKLFRRAMDYFTAIDRGFDGTITEWLEATTAEDDRVVIDGRHEVPLSVLVRTENDRVRFDADPNSAVFVEK